MSSFPSDHFKPSILTSFKDQDIFGHRIGLNYMRRSQTYQTSIGALVSIAIKCVIFAYFIHLFV